MRQGLLSKPGWSGTCVGAQAGPEFNRDPPDSDPSSGVQGWNYRPIPPRWASPGPSIHT